MRMKDTHQKFISPPEEFQLQIMSLQYRFSFSYSDITMLLDVVVNVDIVVFTSQQMPMSEIYIETFFTDTMIFSRSTNSSIITQSVKRVCDVSATLTT
jgi:hypothetical protein